MNFLPWARKIFRLKPNGSKILDDPRILYHLSYEDDFGWLYVTPACNRSLHIHICHDLWCNIEDELWLDEFEDVERAIRHNMDSEFDKFKPPGFFNSHRTY